MIPMQRRHIASLSICDRRKKWFSGFEPVQSDASSLFLFRLLPAVKWKGHAPRQCHQNQKSRNLIRKLQNFNEAQRPTSSRLHNRHKAYYKNALSTLRIYLLPAASFLLFWGLYVHARGLADLTPEIILC